MLLITNIDRIPKIKNNRLKIFAIHAKFSSPVLRDSYRSDASLNSITIRVQLLFWLSKNVTTNDTLLYRMSLFLTNIMMTFLILTVYYI